MLEEIAYSSKETANIFAEKKNLSPQRKPSAIFNNANNYLVHNRILYYFRKIASPIDYQVFTKEKEIQTRIDKITH
jgi:hypothetical protein